MTAIPVTGWCRSVLLLTINGRHIFWNVYKFNFFLNSFRRCICWTRYYSQIFSKTKSRPKHLQHFHLALSLNRKSKWQNKLCPKYYFLFSVYRFYAGLLKILQKYALIVIFCSMKYSNTLYVYLRPWKMLEISENSQRSWDQCVAQQLNPSCSVIT